MTIRMGVYWVIVACYVMTTQFVSAAEKIVFSHYLPKDYVGKMVDSFEKKNPDIEVNAISCGFRDCHDKLTIALSVGESAPDVVSISTIKLGTFVDSGGLTDLSDPPYSIGKTGWQFDPSMITLASNANGDIFGVPYDTGPVVMAYRKDLLDSVGADIDGITENWDSFLRFARTLKTRKGAYVLPAATSLINPLVMGTNNEAGLPVYLKDGKPNLASKEIKALVRISRTLYREGLVAALDGSSNDQKFIKLYRQGKLFADIDGPWIEGRVQQEYDPEGVKAGLWRVSGIPGDIDVNAGGTVFSIPVQSEHKKAAWRFIRFLMQDQNVLQIAETAGTLPARTEVYDTPFFDRPSAIFGGQKSLRLYTSIVRDIKPYAASPVDNIANTILNDAVRKIISQDGDIDAILHDANKLLQRRMRTLR